MLTVSNGLLEKCPMSFENDCGGHVFQILSPRVGPRYAPNVLETNQVAQLLVSHAQNIHSPDVHQSNGGVFMEKSPGLDDVS